MALPILDGNQSATTLSTILSSGQHIPAHTVVSLGTQAITDMRGAVSGSVVSISNFPATQPVSIASVTIGNTVTIAGTVSVRTDLDVNSSQPCVAVAFDSTAGVQRVGNTNGFPIRPMQDGAGNSIPLAISGTVTANPTGTQTIAGTVTANLGTIQVKNFNNVITSGYFKQAFDESLQVSGMGDDGAVLSQISSVFGLNLSSATGSLPISGTVTANLGSALPAGTAQIGSVTASISTSVTIGSLPAISGTVTANTFALQGTAVTTSNFTSTTASTVLAGYNATREVLTIFNEGAGLLFVCPGATCTTVQYQVRLSSGDYYEVPNHQTTITHSAVFATAGTARVTEVS